MKTAALHDIDVDPVPCSACEERLQEIDDLQDRVERLRDEMDEALDGAIPAEEAGTIVEALRAFMAREPSCKGCGDTKVCLRCRGELALVWAGIA
jgi:hypothetical protein